MSYVFFFVQYFVLVKRLISCGLLNHPARRGCFVLRMMVSDKVQARERERERENVVVFVIQ